MAKITSLTAEEKETLSRLGKKLPKELKRQDRQASSPTKAGKDAKASKTNQTVNQANNGGSPGSDMGHTVKATPVKITAKVSKERS